MLLRKTSDFLSEFHKSATFKLRTLSQRLNSMERKLDFLESSLKHCDPSERGAKPIPFKGSLCDHRVRSKLIQQHLIQKRKFKKRVLTEIHNVVNPVNPQRIERAISIQSTFQSTFEMKENSANPMNAQNSINPINARSDSVTESIDSVRSKIPMIPIPEIPIPEIPIPPIPPTPDAVSEEDEKSRSVISTRTPSPDLSAIDSTFFNKEGRISRTGSLHQKYGPPPEELPISPLNQSVIPPKNPMKRLPFDLGAAIRNRKEIKLKPIIPIESEEERHSTGHLMADSVERKKSWSRSGFISKQETEQEMEQKQNEENEVDQGLVTRGRLSGSQSSHNNEGAVPPPPPPPPASPVVQSDGDLKVKGPPPIPRVTAMQKSKGPPPPPRK